MAGVSVDIDALVSSDPNIKKIIDDYPSKMIPTKLKSRTGKAKTNLYEEIDLNLYQNEPKMITFHTSRPRIQPWIKTMDLFYYHYLGKDESLEIKWYDTPDIWVDINNNNSVVIEVIDKKDNSNLMYGLTFFVTTGTIRVQGKRYMIFVQEHFKILKDILNKVLDIWKDVIDEIDDHTITSDTSESESELENSQTSVKCHLETTIVTPSDLSNLEETFSAALQKLDTHQSQDCAKMQTICADINIIKTTCLDIKEQLTRRTQKENRAESNLENTIHTLKNKVQCLESQIQTERGNTELMKATYESNIKTLKSLADDNRQQYKQANENHQQEIEQLQRKLSDKELELMKYKESNNTLQDKLDRAHDEILNIKTQLSSTLDRNLGADDMQPVIRQRPPNKPHVLLIGTSNCKEINEARLSDSVVVTKIIKYVIKDAKSYIVSCSGYNFDVVALHILTNDLKTMSPQNCVKELEDLVELIKSKWPHVKVIISLTTPRKDDLVHHTNGQILNALLKQLVISKQDDSIQYCEHTNMLFQGNPLDELLSEDQYHLSQKGVSYLANNFKRAIHSALDIPLPTKQRGRSPGRSFNRGTRGRGRGFER